MSESDVVSRVEVPGGSVRVERSGSDDTVVVLAHGAGGNMDSKNVLRLRDLLRDCGVSVVRFNFLYKEVGKGLPDRMPTLMATYSAVVEWVRAESSPRRLVAAGHSMGGRTASMLAAEGFAMDGLLLFGYPLHPAGKPEKLRDAHLPSIQVPTLCVNGTADELCTPALMEAVLPRLAPTFRMHWVEHADHSLEVRRASGRTNAEVGAELREVVGGWLTARID